MNEEYGDAISFTDKLTKETLWEMYTMQLQQYEETKKELEKKEIFLRSPWWSFYPSENTFLGIKAGRIEWRAYRKITFKKNEGNFHDE